MHLATDTLSHAMILDSLSDGVLAVDERGEIIYLNPAAERLTGWAREDVLGRAYDELFEGCGCERLVAQTLRTGRGLAGRASWLRGIGGRRLEIRASTAAIRDADGCVVGATVLVRRRAATWPRADGVPVGGGLPIIGRSPPMMQLLEMIPRCADSVSTVLIEGASGTGKELVARAIHDLSPRRGKPFVAINCAALPDSLLESELFGYKTGAFTDARRDKPGRFELADTGTIFLDEIGDISPAMQVKLLRVLQERVFEPLGSVESVRVDVRVIAATNQNLSALVAAGAFRQDLYYRLNIIRFQLPSLSERREDLPLLIEYFITKFNQRLNRQIAGVSAEVLGTLQAYDFPGNIRELENIVEHAFAFCRTDRIEIEHLPPLNGKPVEGSKPVRAAALTLRELERLHIEDALRRCGGNRKAAAHELGIDPSTLFRKLKQRGIPPRERESRRKPR